MVWLVAVFVVALLLGEMSIEERWTVTEQFPCLMEAVHLSLVALLAVERVIEVQHLGMASQGVPIQVGLG